MTLAGNAWRKQIQTENFVVPQVLTKYMAGRHSNDKEYLRKKTLLELGSGTGLVGLAVGLLEPTSEVWITDQK